ncbi:MAG TPA: glycosyltransferase family 4 protein [Methylomirabilota bacterium]|nr:glycosyltransferase family 4 protein [Methylomirabilota bacterium]
MRVAFLTTDNREFTKSYGQPFPFFGTAPQAVLQGFATLTGLECHVVCCLQQPASMPEKIGPNIWYHGLVVPKLGWMRTGYLGCVRAVRRRLKLIQPDIVHGQGTERECAMCAVLSGYPNVLTLHGIMGRMARVLRARPGSFYWMASLLESFAIRRSMGVLCNSSYTESALRGRARRTWRVANPVRSVFFEQPVGSGRLKPPRLLNVGTIAPHKRQIEVLDLGHRLFRRGLEFELVFIGDLDSDSAYGAEFQRRLAAVSAAGFARFEGRKEEEALRACYDSASALLHFPLEESFGLVVAEALARNLKLFGSRTGGMVDVAEGVEGAELFEPDDWPAAESAIEKWLRTGGVAPLGAAATIRERYSPARIAARHQQIYEEVLSNFS